MLLKGFKKNASKKLEKESALKYILTRGLDHYFKRGLDFNLKEKKV
jgi:hypothetical protein